jgi:hypothetical protein
MKIYGPDGRPVLESAEQRMDAAMASIQKSLMSAALKGVAFEDDSQVAHIEASRFEDKKRPRVEVDAVKVMVEGGMRALVQCTLEVWVECGLEDQRFRIEENSCPGTGIVGAAIDSAIADGEENGVCWACNLNGRNKILRVEGYDRGRDGDGPLVGIHVDK